MRLGCGGRPGLLLLREVARTGESGCDQKGLCTGQRVASLWTPDQGWGEGSGGTAEGGDASAGGPRWPRVSPAGKDDYDAHLAQVTTSENAPRLTR